MEEKEINMKKLLVIYLIMMVVGIPLAAQEEEAHEQPQQEAPQQAQQNSGAQVGVKMGRMGMGTLNIDGMFLTGARARGAYQEGWAKDGNWALEGIQATWEENRADLYIHYAFRNYGAFLGLRAQYYGPNNVSYGFVDPRYAFIYGDFGPAKVSVGRLYDELLPVPGSRIWKSTGPGDSHRFTDDDEYSVRVEVKPVEGLNVGFQWFFPQFDEFSLRTDGRDSISGYYTDGMDETDAWKEIGIGAQYSNSLFDAQLGVRFDSKVDRYWKLDTGPQGAGSYLGAYYGSANILARQMTDPRAILSALSPDGNRLPVYKHWDKLVKTTVDMSDPSNPQVTAEWLPYGDGHYAFFGFSFNGVPGLTARAHGGLYNLGAFDEFGYGRFSEEFNYRITPKLSAGIVMQQELYGGDVFDDREEVADSRNPGTMIPNPNYRVNSPFLKFEPKISYALVTIPQMPIPLLGVTLETSFGICTDVVDIYAKVKPVVNIALGALMIDVFYELEYTGWTEEVQGVTGKPFTRHTIGLGALLLF